jgi:hypothetical protein
MRLTELFVTEKVIAEDTEVSSSGRALITLSLADIYDMTLQPYPEVVDPDTGRSVQPDGFFTKRQYGVGVPDDTGQVEAGSIHPGMVQAYRQWQEGGALPGLLLDANGEIRPYNENIYLEDFAWRAASGLSSLAGDLTAAGAYALDAAFELGEDGAQELWNQVLNNGSVAGNFAKRMGASNWEDAPIDEKGFGALDWISTDPLKVNQFAQYLDDKTDLSFRDAGDLMANSVTSGSDMLALLIGGDARQAQSWAGLGAMYATELPKTLLDYGIIAVGSLAGPPGTAAATGLLATTNAAEAAGAAINQIQDVIDANYDSGDLQKTTQWTSAMGLAREQLIYDGELGEGAEPSEMQIAQMEELAKRVIQTNTYNAVVLPIAGTAAVLDTVSDKMLLGNMRMPNPINGRAMTRWAAKGFVSANIEGGEEALQEIWTQRGLLNEAGVPRDPSQVINAYYQGVVVGKAEGAVATATDTLSSLVSYLGSEGNNQTDNQKSARALLRQYFYGADAGDPVILMQIQSMDSNLLRNNVLNDEGRLDIANKIRERGVITDIEQKDDNGEYIFSRFQRFRLRRGLTITMDDGTEITEDYIQRTNRSLDLISVIDGMMYNRQQGRYDVNFENEQDIIDAAKALGIDVEGRGLDFRGKRRINRIMADLENVYKLDVRIQGRSDLEAPSWQDLSPAQKASYVNQGYVDFTNEDKDGGRIGQRWTRDEIDRTTQRDGNWDQVPQEVKDVAAPIDPRPNILNSPQIANEINSAQDYLDSFETRAKRELGQEQTRWDNRNPGADPLDAANPRPNEENNENYKTLMSASRGETTVTRPIAQQLAAAQQDIREAGEAWDAEYARDFNRNGTPRMASRLNMTGGRGDGEAEVASRRQAGNQAPEVQEPEVTSTDDTDEIITPITPDDITAEDDVMAAPYQSPSNQPFGDLARGLTVFNTKYRLASEPMAPGAVKSMIEDLEKTYPGIETEVFGSGGVDSYIESQEEFANNVAENPPSLPMTEAPKRPMTGMEAELDGQTFVYPGGMWISVNEDGTRGRPATKEQQQRLTDQALDRTVPVLPTTVDQADTRPVYINPERPEVQTTVAELPEYSEGDTVEYRRVDGSTNDAEFVRELDNGNIQVFKNGATYALTPQQISAASIDNFEITTTPPPPSEVERTKENNWGLDATDPRGRDQRNIPPAPQVKEPEAEPEVKEPEAEPEVFDPSAETPIDQQFADVEVPQSVKDEYADVLATQNGIKIMQFLDGLPPEQAGSLRVNTPRPGDDGDADDATTAIEPEVTDTSTTTEPQVTGSGRGDGQIEVDTRRAEREAAERIAAANQETADKDAIRAEAARIAAEREAEAQELAIKDSIRDQAAEEAQRMQAAEEETANRDEIRRAAKQIAADNNAAEREADIQAEIAQQAEDLANKNAAEQELAIRNSIRAAAAEAAAEAKAEADEAEQREAVRVAAEERAKEIASQNEIADDRLKDINDEIRRRAEAEADLAAEQREDEIRKQIEDQIEVIQDIEQPTTDSDTDSGIDNTDTDSVAPVVPERPVAPEQPTQDTPPKVSQPDGPESPATGSGRGDGAAELAARNAEIKRQATQRAQDAFRTAQQRIRQADQQAMDAEREKAAQRAADRQAEIDAQAEQEANKQAQAELDARKQAQQDAEAQAQQDAENQTQQEPIVEPEISQPIDQQVTAKDFENDPTIDTGLATNTALPVATAVTTNTNKDADKNRARIGAGRGKNPAAKEPSTYFTPRFNTLAMPDPMNLMRYKSFGDSTQDTRDPVNETPNIPKLTRDQKDAISGTGKYKPTPKPAAPTNVGRSSSTPRFSTLAMPDPLGVNRYKNFESKKKGK